jgi:peptidoglycan/LPS O-acetylase OafA/YrhL
MTVSATNPRRSYFVGLDVIRLAAAVFVMLFHLGYWSWAPASSTTKSLFGGQIPEMPELAAFTWWGWVGVQTFFVISGFVILASATGSTPARFAEHRFLRLMPCVWICASITFCVLIAVEGLTATSPILFLKTLFLFPVAPWVDGVYWTLIVEIVFYGLVWLALKCGQIKHVELLATLLALGGAASWLATWALSSMGVEIGILMQKALGTWLFAALLIRHGIYFCIGVLLYIVSQNGLTARRTAVLALCVLAAYPEIADITSTRSSLVGQSLPPLVPYMVFVGSLICLAASIYYNTYLAAALHRWRLQSASRLAGLTTYPLYLLHNVVGAALLSVAATALVLPLALTVSMSLIVLLAILVASIAEPKLRALVALGFNRFRLTTRKV